MNCNVVEIETSTPRGKTIKRFDYTPPVVDGASFKCALCPVISSSRNSWATHQYERHRPEVNFNIDGVGAYTVLRVNDILKCPACNDVEFDSFSHLRVHLIKCALKRRVCESTSELKQKHNLGIWLKST